MIETPYLNVINIPCIMAPDGRRYLDALWHKDFVAHLDHIRHLSMACPLRHEPPAGTDLEIDPAAFDGRLTFVDLPPGRSTLSALKGLPASVARLWGAVGRSGIVHGGAAGWPIPYGWLAIPMAKVRGKFTVIVIESAPWRLGFARPYRPKGLARAIAFEAMARLLVNLCDLAFFTQAGYRDSLLRKARKARGHVISASWVDPENILPRAEAEALWASKLADPSRPLRLVYAAHLSRPKGLHVLLEAAEILDRRGVPAVVDVYGKGPLEPDAAALAGRLAGPVSIRLRGMTEYGRPFFEMLRGYDLMAVAIISDEQPRVIYDSFSQALPVVASATRGNLECVTDGRDGVVVPIGDAAALADAIESASRDRGRLRDLGISALDAAAALTHDKMHATRAAIIEEATAPRVASPA